MSTSKKKVVPEKTSELEVALTRAIDFTASFKKNKLHQQESKTAKQQREKLESLQNELIKSKQLVIKHVVNCRKIEQALKHSTNTGDAIKKHVQVLPTISKRKNKRMQRTQWMNETDLHFLDVAGGLVQGTSSVLQRSLNMYNDVQLTQELNAFPESQLNAMTLLLFSKVGWISSGKRVSLTEASRMFDEASSVTTLLLQRRPHEQFDHIRWKVLKRMLRTLLRLRHLADSYLAFENELRVRSSHSKNRGKPESSTSPGHLASRTQIFDASSRGDSLDTPLAKTLPHLTKQLTNSKKRQDDLAKLIKSDMSKVSRSVPIGSMKAAHQFARNTGATKMMGVFHQKVLGFYRIVFRRFRNNVTMYRAEDESAKFQRLFGTWRLCRIFDIALLSKIHRHFHDWVDKVQNMKDNEDWAAVVEIQRVGRGCIGRFNVRNRHRIAGCKQIQRVVRGCLARKRCRQLAYQRKLRWAVQVVETAWRSCKWIRTLKNLFILRKQILASELIQRVYRGHVGRTEFRRRKLRRDQNKGALKMQCLWRRYEAICMVADYYSRWKQVEGSITIQARVRGVQGRARAKRFRLWVEKTCVIQRAIRCRLARDRVYHRRRFVAARNIQRCWRGFVTRKRVMKLLLAKRKAREEANYALDMIKKTIHGHYIRRKWSPIIKVYTAKRVAAMQKIKTRYKAVKIGNQTRKHLAHLSRAAAVITRAIRRFIVLCSDRARKQRFLNDSATTIQAAFRGLQGRRYFAVYVEKRKREMDMKMPLYYRLQKMYLRDQNAFHAKQAIKIQCMVRIFIARRVVHAMRLQKSAKLLQYVARKFIDRQRAKDIVREKKNALYYRDRMATRIQKVHRGNLGRYESSKHRYADMLKWFLSECKQVGLLKRCCVNFR